MRVTGRSGRARDRKGWTGWKNQRGAAAVELGLVMPFLVLLLFGIIEFARAWNVKQVLTDAAREGTRIAVVAERQNLTAVQLTDSVTRVVRRAAVGAGLDTSKLTINATDGVGGTAGTEARVQLTYDYQPLFGTWVMPATALQFRTNSVMRNE